jgi:hypothetical protein
MKLPILFSLVLFLSLSCGPQEGQRPPGPRYPLDPVETGGTGPGSDTPLVTPSPGGVATSESINYLQNLEKNYNCGPRWKMVFHSTNFDTSRVNSIQEGPIHGAQIQKVFVGKSTGVSFGRDLIYLEQVSDDGVNTKGFNITFSFCKKTFDKIYYEGRDIKLSLLGNIVLDSDTHKTYSSVDKATARMDFVQFTVQNFNGIPNNTIKLMADWTNIVFSKIE